MKINLNFWPFSYIIRKREERRQALKDELLVEIISELEQKKEDLARSAKKELSSACDEFMKDIDKRKKGIQAEVDGLSRKVAQFGGRSDSAVKAARTVKKDSQRMTAIAEGINTEAEEAAKTRATIKELAGNIDAKLKEFAELAVAQCTEKVGALERELLQALREDHKLNVGEGVEVLDERNYGRTTKYLDTVDQKVGEVIQKLEETHTEYSGKLKLLTEQAQSILTQVQDDARYLVDTFQYIRQNIPLVAYAVGLSDPQKYLLRELFTEKYDGDLVKLKRDLIEKSRGVQGKDIALDELDLKYAESGIKEMVNFVRRQKSNLRALLETVERIENVYKRDSKSSGRDRRR